MGAHLKCGHTGDCCEYHGGSKTDAWILEQLRSILLVKQNEEKEDEIFWSHHQTQQPGKDHHPRDHCREERQRETSKNLGERHRGMDEGKHW